MITIVDYGTCNVGSLANMFKRLRATCEVTQDPEVVARSQRLVLPGIGAFDSGMRRLNESGLAEALRYSVLERRTPILGICLGMQVFGSGSEEGNLSGLNFLPIVSQKFNFSNQNLRVPHMGWNNVRPKVEHPLYNGLSDRARFYFVHSFKVVSPDPKYVLATSQYGGEFAASIFFQNIMAVQFHPEKSHRFGLRLLANFTEI